MRGLGSYNSSNTCCMSAPVVAAARFIQLAPPALAQADPRMNATCHYNSIQVHFDTIYSCRCLPSIHTNSRKDLCKLPHLRDKDEATKGRTNVVAVYLVNVAEVEHVRPPHLTEQFG